VSFAGDPQRSPRTFADRRTTVAACGLLVAFAARAGASGTAVEQGIRDLTFGDWVATVTDQASQDGVTATPTVLVDGETLGDLSANGLTAAVATAQEN
jgi:protein-disulfide isomerase